MIAILSILAAFFDAAGLALIYYGVSAFTQTEPSQPLFINLQIESLNLSTILASLTAIYIVRYCVLTYHAYRKSQFIFDVETRSGQEVIIQFLNQNLLRKKANEHINYLNAITKESVQLQAYSISVINLIAEVCQALIIFLFFLFFTPVHYQMAAVAIGVLAYIYINLSGKILSDVAQRRLQSEKLRSKIAQEIITLFKDIQIYDQTKEYVTQYKRSDSDRGKNESKSFFIQSLPKIIFEAVISFTIISFLFLQFIDVVQINDAIPILTVLIILLIKAVPAFMRISTSINSLKYNQQSVEEIYQIINKLAHQREPYKTVALLDSMPAPNNAVTKIEISNLDFSYSQSSKPLFYDWSKTLAAGNLYAVTGDNGVGKSTLLDLIFGLIQLGRGSIAFIDNRDRKVPRDQISIGYLSQNPSLFQKTLEFNITMHRRFRENEFNHALDLTNLTGLMESSEMSLTDKVLLEDRRFSRGQVQRIAFARSNYLEPTILLLDEPFAAVDASSKNKIIESLKARQDRIIIIVTHDNAILSATDEIIHLP